MSDRKVYVNISLTPAEADILDQVVRARALGGREEAIVSLLRQARRDLYEAKFALEVIYREAKKGNMAPYRNLMEKGVVDPEAALAAINRDDMDLDLVNMSTKELEAMVRMYEERLAWRHAPGAKDD